MMMFDVRQVWNSPQLPQFSAVAKKLLELSSQPHVMTSEVVELIETDPELGTRLNEVLRFHAASGPPHPSLAHAIDALGVVTVCSLTLAADVQRIYRRALETDVFVEAYWRRAVVKALAADCVCSQISKSRHGDSFLTGLLIDAGRLALALTAREKYQEVTEKARRDHRPVWQVEQSEFGVTSARIGAQLLERWGFPARQVQDLQHQFAPLMTLKQQLVPGELPSGGIVAMASAIGDYFCSDDQALAWFRIRELASEILPMSELDLNDLLRRIEARFPQVAANWQVAGAELPSLERLKLNVIEQLRPIQRRPETHARPVERASGHPGLTPASRVNTGHQPGERQPASVIRPTEPPRNFRDPLTQVYTSEFFEESLYKEVQRCRQTASPLGIAVVTIDRFEKLQQQHGERLGEVILQRIGGVLRDLLRTSDTIARFGNQFAVLASEPTAKGMQRLADRVRGRVVSEQVVWSGQRIPLTVSIGATLALPGRRDEMIGAQVLAKAQKAALEAAQGEGNNVYFEAMVEEIELQRLFMSDHLRFSRWLIARGVLDIPRVGKALLEYKQRQMRLGDLALRQELLSQEQVDQILREQDESQDRFGDVAVRRDLLTEEQLVGLLILQQEDPVSVAELLLRRAVLDEEHLQSLLKEYFSIVPWAAPLYPTTGNG